MIRVIVYNKEGLIAGFQVVGHAPKEFGVSGENLLCAGVSTLLQSVHSYMGWKDRLESETKENGILEFMVRKDHLEGFQSLGEMVKFGLQSLAINHSTAIKITDEIIKG
ncbi:MAG: ribosomal-processing cysteine protease Prp [Leptospira sp.]|nr:ribosomal-processing cysteine protease Prp [Leptospira sp.]